jgi:hypothetical protein
MKARDESEGLGTRVMPDEMLSRFFTGMTSLFALLARRFSEITS